jgi:hypothetical protein
VCSGQTHPCQETGTATQNEVAILTSLFGPAGAEAPTVALVDPLTGSARPAGVAIPINATCSSSDGVKELDILVDGIQISTSATSPVTVMTAPNLAVGTHHIKALCGSNKQATAAATADVIVGASCTTDAECSGTGQICYQMTCVDGPGATGGLGATCATDADCKYGKCASDGTQSLCVIACDSNQHNCPGGFGCIDDGTGTGTLCWLGADDGGGGCCDVHHGDSRGSIVFGLGFAALWIKRRRKPR